MGDKANESEKDNLMISNILCYISTAKCVLRADDIVRSCLALYSQDEIIKGKDLLFELVGEKPKRRRNEDRILHELQDIMALFEKCDDNEVQLPIFVANSYNSFPPTSGFEHVADRLMTLNEEIVSLRKEVEALKESRLTDNILSQNNTIMQEDILLIKSELRKLNHKFMEEDIRRNSLILCATEKQSSSERSIVSNALPISCEAPVLPSETDDLCNDYDLHGRETDDLSPSAPELPEDQLLLNRLIFDEGGTPSAPSYSQVCKSKQHSKDKSAIPPAEDISLVARKEEIGKSSSNTAPARANNMANADDRVDEDGFILVKNKKQKRNAVGSKRNVVGSRTSNTGSLKSAARTADLYIGNCDVEVSVDSLIEYIYDVTEIRVKKCEELITKYDDYKSFKVSLLLNDRVRLLSSDIWPEGIVCRKYFNPKNQSTK